MTPHTQRFRHDPDAGVFGDCFRTAIACLLEIDPEEVPHHHRVLAGGEQSRLLRSWLMMRGLTLIELAWPTETLFDLLVNLEHAIGDTGMKFMVSGQSPRGTDHVVICDTKGFVHDPHPDGGFLTGPMDDGNWFVSWIGKHT